MLLSRESTISTEIDAVKRKNINKKFQSSVVCCHFARTQIIIKETHYPNDNLLFEKKQNKKRKEEIILSVFCYRKQKQNIVFSVNCFANRFAQGGVTVLRFIYETEKKENNTIYFGGAIKNEKYNHLLSSSFIFFLSFTRSHFL